MVNSDNLSWPTPLIVYLLGLSPQISSWPSEYISIPWRPSFTHGTRPRCSLSACWRSSSWRGVRVGRWRPSCKRLRRAFSCDWGQNRTLNRRHCSCRALCWSLLDFRFHLSNSLPSCISQVFRTQCLRRLGGGRLCNVSCLQLPISCRRLVTGVSNHLVLQFLHNLVSIGKTPIRFAVNAPCRSNIHYPAQ